MISPSHISASSSDSPPQDVVVVGAGIVGMSSALFMMLFGDAKQMCEKIIKALEA